MKSLLKKTGFIILPAALILSVVSCSKSDTPAPVVNPNINGNITLTTLQAQVDSLQKEPVSQTELNSILYMREEEKLARDVYTTLYNKWGSTIFTNISAAEQTHMDALLMLINKYGLTDPVGSNPVGVFSDTTLQNLYNQLVVQGTVSIPAAFITGATIEDLDIYDLKNAVTTIDNKDILLVYDNLTKGSRNHLRSFYQNILKVGATYTPQYITQAEFDAIINSAMETGF